MKSILFTTLILVSTIAHAADVYEWRDAQGEEHFSDTPPPTDQEGVQLVKVNGQDINVFHDDVTESTVAAALPDRKSKSTLVPRDDADCAEIHGRTCDWNDDWRRYAEANCARVGDGHCGNEAHLRAHYDPRIHARQHAARHGHR